MTYPDFEGIKLYLKQDEIKTTKVQDGAESRIENIESSQRIGEKDASVAGEHFSTMHPQDTILFQGNHGYVTTNIHRGGKLRLRKAPQESDDVAQVQMDLAHYNKVLETTKSELENEKMSLHQKTEEINMMRDELERRRILLGLRDSEISSLRSELEGYRSSVFKGDVSELREELEASTKRLKEQSAQIHLLRGELEQRNIKIINLKKELHSLRTSVDAALQELPAFTDLSEQSTSGRDAFISTTKLTRDNSPPQIIDRPPRPKKLHTSTAKCEFCHNEFSLQDNLAGLVIANGHFACEDCCRTHSKPELLAWTKSLTSDPSEVQPIRSWVTKKNNKSKSKLFRLFKK
jgi:hypothetical protein